MTILSRRSFFFGVAAAAVVVKLPPIVVEEATGFAVPVNEHLIRSQLWSAQIKEALLKDLVSMKFVRTYTKKMADTLFEKSLLIWLKDGADEGYMSEPEAAYLIELVERDIELKEF